MPIFFDSIFWRSITFFNIIIVGLVIFFVFLISGVLARVWLVFRRAKYRKSIQFVSLAIDIPPEEIKTPKAAENLIAQLYAVKSRFNFWEKWWKGQYTLQASLEIVGQDGYIQFMAYVPKKYQTLFEKSVYAQFPEANISEVSDYTESVNEQELVSEDRKNGRWEMWGTEFILAKPSFYPIRTYVLFSDQVEKEFADPLASMLEIMSHLKRDERFWYQITLAPTRKNWQEQGSCAIKNIIGGVLEKRSLYYKLFSKLRYFIFEILYLIFETVIGSVKKEKKENLFRLLTMVPPEQELIVKAIREKISRLGFVVYIRVLYIADKAVYDARHAAGDFQGIMRQFANPQMNSLASNTKIEVEFPQFLFPKFRAKLRKKWLLKRAKLRTSGIGPDQIPFWHKFYADCARNILSVEEIASLWHFPVPDLANTNSLIRRVFSKKVHPKQVLPEDDTDFNLDNKVPFLHKEITFFARTNFRKINRQFGIIREDRRRHMYIIGKTGMGKTTCLENMIYQDIVRGEGVAVIDPHGDLVERIIDLIPSSRINDTIYFNPGDMDFPVAFNILAQEDPRHRYLVVSSLVGIFKKIWADSWGPRLEYLLRNSLLTLLETEGNTILGVSRIFVDDVYRKRLVARAVDPVVKSFWTREYAKYNQNFQIEAISPIQNKIGQFISIPLIRNMIGQVKSKINFGEILDNKKIFLVNLAKGLIGEDVSALLGATIISKLQIASMMRADIEEEKRADFYLYIDEFQNFSTESFAAILSEARKYRLNLILAHQYIEQLDDMVAASIFGNVGTLVCFGTGASDAEVLESHFAPEFTLQDLVNLGKYEIILRLMIHGAISKPFSAETLAPFGPLEVSSRDKIIKVSRERYSVPRQVIEEKLERWLVPSGAQRPNTKF